MDHHVVQWVLTVEGVQLNLIRLLTLLLQISLSDGFLGLQIEGINPLGLGFTVWYNHTHLLEVYMGIVHCDYIYRGVHMVTVKIRANPDP